MACKYNEFACHYVMAKYVLLLLNDLITITCTALYQIFFIEYATYLINSKIIDQASEKIDT